MEWKALIFDVDGTLAETEEGHRQAFNQAFVEWGLGWHWDEPLYKKLLETTGGKERIRAFQQQRPAEEQLSDDRIGALHRRKTELYAEILSSGGLSLRPGVEALMAEGRLQGAKLAIATTTTPENVSYLLESTLGKDAIDLFDVIGAGDIVLQKKPAPDIYFWVLNQLNLQPQQCIAIEDSENGLQAARAAGLPTLITVNNYTRLQNFEGAVAVLSDLGEPDQIFDPVSSLPVHLDKQWIDTESLRKLVDP